MSSSFPGTRKSKIEDRKSNHEPQSLKIEQKTRNYEIENIETTRFHEINTDSKHILMVEPEPEK